jgi:hypothetical protein
MNTVLQTWMESVNAGDIEGVLELYDESATLLPTFSPQQAASKAAIRDYFENLAAKGAPSVELHADSICAHQIGNTAECVCGHYTFSYEVDGKIQSFASRFTFVIDANSDHPIIHHHSSQIPQPHSA